MVFPGVEQSRVIEVRAEADVRQRNRHRAPVEHVPVRKRTRGRPVVRPLVDPGLARVEAVLAACVVKSRHPPSSPRPVRVGVVAAAAVHADPDPAPLSEDGDPIVPAVQVDPDFLCLVGIQGAAEVRGALRPRQADANLHRAVLPVLQFEVLVLVRPRDLDLSADQPVVPCRELAEIAAARLQRPGDEVPHLLVVRVRQAPDGFPRSPGPATRPVPR